MTQQSLITQLKAVEEALEYAERRLASSQPEVARDTRTHISEPLSDLRELIKEAEGQEPDTYKYRVYMPLGEKAWVTHDRVRDRPVLETKALYTSLGEKP